LVTSRWPEGRIIDFVRRLAGSGGEGDRAGLRDDCAALRVPPGRELLVTTDLFVEGVHFTRANIRPGQAGHRCLCRGLSDIAAMGGEPHWAFLSLALPRRPAVAWARAFLRGLARAADEYGVALAGGDTGCSGSDIHVADMVLIGSAPEGQAVLRSGARPGDLLFVSGRLGATARALDRGERLPPIRPRLALGRLLRERRLASAMIDISDGLSTDANHLSQESGVAIRLTEMQIPRAGTIEQALHGGEDYELLFSVSPAKAGGIMPDMAGVPLRAIGMVVEGKGVWLRENSGRRRRLRPAGWEHFST